MKLGKKKVAPSPAAAASELDATSEDEWLSDEEGSSLFTESLAETEAETEAETDRAGGGGGSPEASVTSSTKKKSKRVVVGQVAQHRTKKESRDALRQEVLDEIMEDFAAKPDAEPEKQPPKDHRRPLYRIRRILNCCVHVPLEEAVLEGNTDQVRSYVTRWGNKEGGSERINWRNDKGRSALSLAIKEQREDLADFIISIGEANVDQSDRETSLSPLHQAVQLGEVNTIKKLALRSVKPDARDSTGMTPLMLACLLGNYTITDMLIEMGAECEAKDKSGWRPLHYAAYGGSVDVVELLLEQGVPHRKKDKFGLRPIDWAQHAGHGEAASYLETFVPALGGLAAYEIPDGIF